MLGFNLPCQTVESSDGGVATMVQTGAAMAKPFLCQRQGYLLLLLWLVAQSRAKLFPEASSDAGYQSQPTTTTRTDEDDVVDDSIPHLLLSHIQTIQSCHQDPDRPCVTLAYAQSLDGKLAYFTSTEDGQQLLSSRAPISGPAAYRCTHALRSIHDGILVGGNTWALDRPRLTNRVWMHAASLQHQPVPIVLDTHLRHVVGYTGNGRRVIVCCSNDAVIPWDDIPEGMELVRCRYHEDDRCLDLAHVLQQLKHVCSIHTLMVEGGPTVLETFFSNSSLLIDCVALTVSTRLVVGRGVAPYRRNPCKLFQDARNLEVLPLNDGEDVLLLYEVKPFETRQ